MRFLLKEYEAENPEQFNEELIYLKDQDSVLDHVKNIYQALEDVIKGLTFLECSLNKDESSFPKWTKKGEDKNYVNIEYSRLQMINLKFKIEDPKGEEPDEIIERYLYFPKLIDHTYFILNGNKFFPIYQIIDSATYNNKGSLTLKTLLMLITIRRSSDTFKDIFGEEYEERIKVIDLFSNKLNYLLYFFVDRGFDKTIEYFVGENWEEDVLLADKEEIDLDATSEDYKIFQLADNKEGSTILLLSKELFEKDKSFCLNLVDILIGKNEFQIVDNRFWKIELGRVFSRNKNSYESKADDILTSYKRILDNSTKNTLRLRESNKNDIFALTRWMTKNFDELVIRDNMDLKYKRIRVNEYLYYELLIKTSTATYRILNKNNVEMKDLRQLFSTLSPMFIVKKMGSNQLLRYMGGVNAIELFNPMLKVSFRGHQGLGEGNKNVNNIYRGLHPSYIGRLGLTSSSAGDPGMTATFVPFMQNNGFYFTDDQLD
jgi:hypothetical protein